MTQTVVRITTTRWFLESINRLVQKSQSTALKKHDPDDLWRRRRRGCKQVGGGLGKEVTNSGLTKLDTSRIGCLGTMPHPNSVLPTCVGSVAVRHGRNMSQRNRD
jgi:hypothetical protein